MVKKVLRLFMPLSTQGFRGLWLNGNGPVGEPIKLLIVLRAMCERMPGPRSLTDLF